MSRPARRGDAHALTNRRPFKILRQPDDSTCGPTCLHAVYQHFGQDLSLDAVLGDVAMLADGGTLAVFLANDALRRGYDATIVTYNLHMFDPTWFSQGEVDLAERLTAQARAKDDPKLQAATAGYLEFLELGGRLQFADLSAELIHRNVSLDHPILTGLSATYLYRSARELTDTGDYDDLRGEPVGHFVVLCGMAPGGRILIADPLHPNPVSDTGIYAVNVERLINAILLGVLTYDANLLVLDPPEPPPDAG